MQHRPTNFIWVYNAEKPPHVLLKFSLDKLVMQEVSYHILAGLSARLHQKKKAPWLTLPLCIRSYKIHTFKHVDVEVEEMKKYPFDAQSYNPYDPHCLVEDPWKYCHSFSRPNASVDLIVEWLMKQHEATSRRAATIEVNI